MSNSITKKYTTAVTTTTTFDSMRKELTKYGAVTQPVQSMDSLEVAIVIDMTRSMRGVLKGLAKTIPSISQAVKRFAPNSRFSGHLCRNHGDEEDYGAILITSELSESTEGLRSLLLNVRWGGGGQDGLVAFEEAFRAVNALSWGKNTRKIVLVFGDRSAQSVDDCPNHIDYRAEINSMLARHTKIIAVDCDPGSKHTKFFKSLASEGTYIPFTEVDLVEELITTLCLREIKKLDHFLQTTPESRQIGYQRVLKLLKA